MSNPKSIQVRNFDRVFEAWKSSIAHALVRTVSVRVDNGWRLLTATVDLSPVKNGNIPLGLIETSELRIGAELFNFTSGEIECFIEQARNGCIQLPRCITTLPGERFSEYSPAPFPVHEYAIPQLEIRGERPESVLQSFNHELALAELRSCAVPFDGLADALSFFGFGNRDYLPTDASIVLKLHTPVDVVGTTSLSDNSLRISLLRKSEFPVDGFSLGIRALPNASLQRRLQVASKITWERGENGLESGHIVIDLEACDAAVIMLTVAGQSVRQLFISDPAKSLNPRLQDYRAFDPKLESLNKALRVSKGDARSLEAAVATLLHLQGASAITPPSSDTPDVLAETPRRKVLIVECTIAFNDFYDKVGKLAGRRETLIRHHINAGIQREVLALMVINTYPQLTPGETKYLVEQQVALVTLGDLERAVATLDVPTNLDDLFDGKLEELRQQLNAITGQGSFAFQ